MTITIRDAMLDPQLFGDIFGGDSFAAWRALLSGFHGLDLDEAEASTFKALTGRRSAPQGPFSELWLAVGRRGGKSHVAALLAVYMAAFHDYRDRLAPGEVATVMVIAADRKQARAVMRYTSGLVNENPMLRRMVLRENSEQIELNNRCVIEITTASHRSVRGYTLAAAILDEIAFWHADGASPDREIVAAIRPALATLGGRLIALSSPYARRGVLWDTFRRSYGDEGDGRVLVAQAPTLTMNPTLDPAIVERAIRDDPEAARAEYLAEFRSDISSFLDPEMVERATRCKPLELMHSPKHSYFAFVDPAGGGGDEFTLAIGHLERETVVIDLLRGRHGSPAEIVLEYSKILRGFDVFRVYGDRYAGRWPRDEFMRWDITYQVSDLDRSGLYLEMLARLNSGSVELPPDEKLKRQLIALERRTSRAGRDSIDHPPGSHDDRANAVAGVVAYARRRQPSTKTKPLIGLC
ncbi:hypothetical protein [Rhodovulum sp.]|uniref:hypothetical protein n=1 Tax=Rhodovulum sp. TaxID=34009 RepID=UPI0017F3A068|nr:hypothetical protein [Rhodovulum sp.]HDR28855.1 hypothetical protein [Rhodovulum sp.]